MSFKINFNTTGSVPTPSDSYYSTKERFDTILKTKLGVSSEGKFSTSGVEAVGNIDYQDVTKASNASASEIDRALSGTAMSGLGSAFSDAEKKYGVNAWFLVGLAAHESGYGTSAIAQTKNNLFGFQAYDASPYSSSKRFNTVEEGIDQVASYLKSNYLTEGGKYYNGTSVDAINEKYATDQNWSNAIMANINRMLGA